MKILLVNAINKAKPIEVSFPPLGLAYIASYLQARASFPVQVRVIDDVDSVEEEMKAFGPDLLGVSSVSQNFGRALKACSLAKARGIPVIVGGVHVTMLPEVIPLTADLAVIGEGEETMLEIVELLNREGALEPNELREIDGIAFREPNGTVHRTRPRSLIVPIDSLPLPDRTLLKMPAKGGLVYLFSSRGCPYKCTFCASTRFWKKARFFSAEYVLKEIKEIIDEYSPRFISFKDDLFVADLQRLNKIVEYIERDRINRRVGFYVSCRADLVTEEVVSLLKRMNVVHVSMGLESGNERILRYLKGRTATIEDGLRAIGLLRKWRVQSNASFIIGSPDETEEEVLDTLNFARRSGLTSFATYVLTPFPGTPLWGEAERRGLVSNDMDWDKLAIDLDDDQQGKIILSEKISRKRLIELLQDFRRLETRKHNYRRLKLLFNDPVAVVSAIRRRVRGVLGNGPGE